MHQLQLTKLQQPYNKYFLNIIKTFKRSKSTLIELCKLNLTSIHQAVIKIIVAFLT
jgi:hypothetical protein